MNVSEIMILFRCFAGREMFIYYSLALYHSDFGCKVTNSKINWILTVLSAIRWCYFRRPKRSVKVVCLLSDASQWLIQVSVVGGRCLFFGAWFRVQRCFSKWVTANGKGGYLIRLGLGRIFGWLVIWGMWRVSGSIKFLSGDIESTLTSTMALLLWCGENERESSKIVGSLSISVVWISSNTSVFSLLRVSGCTMGRMTNSTRPAI